jgi:hypothetical protein
MNCPQCGAAVTERHRFCNACGAAVAGAPAAIAPASATPSPEQAAEREDPRVAAAARKNDVWSLVPLANQYVVGEVGEQAGRALLDMVPRLAAKKKTNELSYLLTLEEHPNLEPAANAAVAALVQTGPKARSLVSARTTTVAGQRRAARYFRGIGYDEAAAELEKRADAAVRHSEDRVALGYAKYVGGRPELGPARSGVLVVTVTHVMLGQEELIAMGDVVDVDVGGGLAAQSRLLPALAFGTIGALAAKGVKDRAEVVVYLKTGDAAFFFVDKRTAVEIRAALMPLLRRLGIPFHSEAQPMAQAPDEKGEDSSPGLADQLLKLKQMHEAGFLDDAELAAAKAKLLG